MPFAPVVSIPFIYERICHQKLDIWFQMLMICPFVAVTDLTSDFSEAFLRIYTK